MPHRAFTAVEEEKMEEKVTQLQIGMLAMKKDKQVREQPGTGEGRPDHKERKFAGPGDVTN